jgi:hypothetical protein
VRQDHCVLIPSLEDCDTLLCEDHRKSASQFLPREETRHDQSLSTPRAFFAASSK